MLSTRRGRAIATAAAILGLTGAAQAETVVQVPLPDLLDARSVTTLTNGNLVVFTLPTDGGNLQNAFATKAVATLKAKPTDNALPDDGKFPANDRHPDVQLHFANDADPTSPQTHLVKPMDVVTFPVPVATYSKFFLFVNGAAGGTKLTITLNYDTTMDVQNATVPDYYADVPANDPVIFNLAANLAKWDKNTAINEANHHNITGVTLTTLPDKKLVGIKVERSLDGNLVFWGATGVATSDVAGLGGSGGSGGGGAASGGMGGAVGAAGGGGGAGTSSGGGAGGTNGGVDSGSGASGASGAGGGIAMAGAATAGTAFIQPAPSSSDDAACSCRAPGRSPSKNGILLFGAAALALSRLRRAR